MTEERQMSIKQAPLADSLEWQENSENVSKEGYETSCDDDAGASLKNDEETEDGASAFAYLQRYAVSENVSERQNAVRHLVKTLQTVEDDDSSVQAVFYIAQRTFAEDSDPIIRAELLEQIPLLAMHCTQWTKLIQYKSTVILPLLVKFLNDANTQVRKTCQAAVSILLEQGLLTTDDIEHCLFPVLFRLSVKDYNADDIRIESVGLLCKLIAPLGREKTISLFLTRFTELSVDSLFHIRKTCASYLGEMSKTLGQEITEKILVPHLIALSQDCVWGVRKACAECFTDVSGFCSMQTRRHRLAPIFICLLADSSRWVQSSAFQALGPFISTFADSNRTGLQWVDGQLVYDEEKINTIEDQMSLGSASELIANVFSSHRIVMPSDSSPTTVGNNQCSSVVSVNDEDTELVDLLDSGSSLIVVNSNIAQLARQRMNETSSSAGDDSSVGVGAADTTAVDAVAELNSSCSSTTPIGEELSSNVGGLDQNSSPSSSNEQSATVPLKSNQEIISSSNNNLSHKNFSSPAPPTSPNSSVNSSDFETTYTSFKFWQPSLPESLPPLIDETTSCNFKNNNNVQQSQGDAGSCGASSSESNVVDEDSVVQSFMERHLRFGNVTSPTDEMMVPLIHSSSAASKTEEKSSQSKNMVSDDDYIQFIKSTTTTGQQNNNLSSTTPSLSLSFEKGSSDEGPLFVKIRPRLESDADESNSFAQQLADKNKPDGLDYQDIIPQALLDQFLSMVEPSRAQAIESDISRHCAFNFPAVALTIGRKHWPLIKPTYDKLANDMQWKVRRTLAFSIHNLAAILGSEITVQDLLPVFTGFLRDLDEVRIGILKHLYDFLKLLDKDVRTKLLGNLADFLQTDNYRNWRFRHLFAEQLILLCELFDIEHINDYLSPIAMTLAIDKVAEIRQVTHCLLATILLHFYRVESERNETTITDSFVKDIIKGFGKSLRWIRRQTFLYVCHEIIRMEAIPASKFATDIVPSLLILSQDSIPNVRIVLANVLTWCLNSTTYFDALPDVVQSLHDVMKRFADDKDRDVRQLVVGYVAQTIYKKMPEFQQQQQNYSSMTEVVDSWEDTS